MPLVRQKAPRLEGEEEGKRRTKHANNEAPRIDERHFRGSQGDLGFSSAVGLARPRQLAGCDGREGLLNGVASCAMRLATPRTCSSMSNSTS
jgi:hypothetical protein